MARTKKTIEPEVQIMKKPVWLKYTSEEVKAIIIKLANRGLTSEKIGLVLKDQYGIPSVKVYQFKIKDVLKEKDKFEEPTVINIKRRLERIIKHYSKNKGDKKAERSLIIIKSKLKKTEDYQKNK